MTTLLCVCGESNHKNWAEVDAVQLVECVICGTIRVRAVDQDSLTNRYSSGEYHAEGDYHETGQALNDRREHDYTVAQSRLSRMEWLALPEHAAVLDVGCANGAFMLAVADRGYRAYGCDLSISAVPIIPGLTVRRGGIGDCGWQRRTFHMITFNDVLEHLTDPVSALRTAKGLLRRDGILAVEIPDMGSTDAKRDGAKFHHVKPHEHLWYWTAGQLRELMEKEGLTVLRVEAPIPGKVTLYASPEAVVEDVTIYGPPGIGDILWTLNKLQDIREREAPCRLTYVVCADTAGARGKLMERAKDFMKLCPLIDNVDFQPLPLPNDDGNTNPAEAKYNLIANVWLEPGNKQLKDWRPELKTDWNIGIATPECALRQARARLGNGTFAAFYISSVVWNQVVAYPDLLPEHYAHLFVKLSDAGIKPVILGAGYDADYAKQVAESIAELGRKPEKIWINVIGRTPIPLAMAYMEIADITVGIANGLPMIPAYNNKPSIILWPTRGVSNTREQFGKEFQTNWVPPYVTNYTPMSVGGFTVDDLYGEILQKVGMKRREGADAAL